MDESATNKEAFPIGNASLEIFYNAEPLVFCFKH
jgi:hypothetical protein